MQKTIDQITDYLAGLVTTDKPAYSPKELLRAKIPSFVVERVRLVLEDKIREELGSGESIWFDFETRLVNESWHDFVNSAIGASHIPKSELYRVLQAVVKDIIYVFIEPRKYFTEYIFREDEELSLAEIEYRCARLTIYKHFSTAIPLYMKKRDLGVLTKDRCTQLIQKLDAKLVAAYTAEDWAQKLEQLFVLFGGNVEPRLLAMFFDDKGLSSMAKRFINKRKRITKTDFIAIISATEADIDNNSAHQSSIIESFFGEYEEDPSKSELFDDSLASLFLEGGLSDEEMTELMTDIASDGVIEVDDHSHVASLNELFLSETESDEHSISQTSEEIAENIRSSGETAPEEIKEFRENLISILDQARNSFDGITKEEKEDIEEEKKAPPSVPKKSAIIADEEAKKEEPLEEVDDSVEQDEEQPMWAKFLRPDQMDVMMGGKRTEVRQETFDTDLEDVFADADEEDGIELGDELLDQDNVIEEPENEHNEELHRLLADRSPEYIDIIFGGSRDEFEQAIETISRFDNWKETSAYIKDDIFKKNNVDLFSGATVDFTDRMHRHFNDRLNT